MSEEFKNYYKNHAGYLADSRELYLLDYFHKNFSELLERYDLSKIKVLEIGCGK